jgi:signal peptidase I
MSDRTKKYAIEVTLTVGALAGLLCVIVALASVAFGLSPLVFRSDSMSPAIATGDVAIARSVSAAELAPGDIVSVSRPDGTRITHRVVSIDSRVGNSATMTLRGDANSINDPEPYTAVTVDRVLFHVPNLGYVLSWFTSPYSWAVATLLTLGLVSAAFRPDRLIHRSNPGRHAASSSPRSRNATLAVQAVIVLTVVATAVTGYVRTNNTLAALNDSATATGTVSAGRPIVPTSLTCTNTYPNIVLSWPNPVSNHSYDYELSLTNVAGGATRTHVKIASTAITATQTITYNTPWFPLAAIYNIDLRSKVGNFLSTGKLTIRIQEGFFTTTCGETNGTPSGTAAARSAPAQTTTTQLPSATTTQAPTTTTLSQAPATSTSTASPAPTTSSTPPPSIPLSEEPTASPAPTSATTLTSVPETTSPAGTYVASANDGTVTIGDKQSGTEEYRGDLRAVQLEWADDVTLKVTAADGTVNTVTKRDGRWSTTSVTATVPAAG